MLFLLIIFPFLFWSTPEHRRTGTFGLGGGRGGVTLLPEKKLHNAQKHVYKCTQIAVKTKTLPILTSNERIIIPKLQLNWNFSNLRGKRKLVRKIGYLEKSGVTEITVSDGEEGNDFCFELSGGSKKGRFEKSGFHCSYFNWNLAYSLTSINYLLKSKTYQRNSKFFLVCKVQEKIETALCGAIENGSFQNHHKKSLQPWTKVLRHFNVVFNFVPCNLRVQKEQIRPPPLHPWCNVVLA